LVGIVVHSDLKKTGWFESNDARLNWLHEATVWSLRDNMCDVPTDCPTRERAGWTGDWQIFAPTAAYLFDVNDFSRKWLADVVVGQREDGAVPNIAPPDFTGSFKGPMAHINASAGWGDAIIAVPLAMYEEYGDTRALEECFDAAEKWISFGLHRSKTQRHPDREKLRPVAAAHEEFLWDTPYHWGEWLEPGVDTTDFGVLLTADRSDVETPYLHRSA
jgi:alpha-L-rhamnosidase